MLETPSPTPQAMAVARKLHRAIALCPGELVTPNGQGCVDCPEIAAVLDAYAAEHCGADVKYERLEAERDAAIAKLETAEARLALVWDYVPACMRDTSLPTCTNRDHRRVRAALNVKAAAAPSEGGKG